MAQWESENYKRCGCMHVVMCARWLLMRLMCKEGGNRVVQHTETKLGQWWFQTNTLVRKCKKIMCVCVYARYWCIAIVGSSQRVPVRVNLTLDIFYGLNITQVLLLRCIDFVADLKIQPDNVINCICF